MKVRDLIELLQEQDPEADVLLATQEQWPFENALLGVIRRDEMLGDDDEPELVEGAEGSDVLLVEGAQLRYGGKGPWRHVREAGDL